MSFTDCEWMLGRIGEDELCITSGRGELWSEPVSHLATLTDPCEFPPGVQLANGRLMRAAREMYHALKSIANYRLNVPGHMSPDAVKLRFVAMQSIAREAIAAAETSR